MILFTSPGPLRILIQSHVETQYPSMLDDESNYIREKHILLPPAETQNSWSVYLFCGHYLESRKRKTGKQKENVRNS